MTKSQVTISVYVKNELKEKFEEVFQESEFNSKGEFLGVLLDTYLNPMEDGTECKQTIKELKDLLQQKESEIQAIKLSKSAGPVKLLDKANEDSHIILPTSPEQVKILQKCYDEKPDLAKEIVKDLVRMACQWIKVKPGVLFFDDEYSRLFTLKGIASEDFETAFPIEIKEMEAELK
jgi:hypothetical protein